MPLILSEIKQIVPETLCFSCQVCCRFPEKTSFLAPVFLEDEFRSILDYGFSPSFFQEFRESRGRRIELIPYKAGYICPLFSPPTNRCSLYPLRPLDCKIYPFILTWDEAGENVVLGMDTKCPFIKDNLESGRLREYSHYLTSLLQLEEVRRIIATAPELVGRYQEDVVRVEILLKLTDEIRKHRLEPREKLISKLKPFGLKPLQLEDKPLWDRYLAEGSRELSNYSFASIYIWSDLINFFWTIRDDSLCLFAEQHGGFFMPLPPLGGSNIERVIYHCFKIMNELNERRPLSRIENVEEAQLDIFKSLGYSYTLKGVEYIYLQKDLVLLKGNRYKGKRSAYNYFVKNYEFSYHPFEGHYLEACLSLYSKWKEERWARYEDPLYRGMLQDSYLAHRKAMMDFQVLGLRGRVVESGGEVKGYTIGYELNRDTFCLAMEITDLKIKGLAQYIFREFCRELGGYRYVNGLDDSGLDNLKKVKISYHPCRLVPSYIISLKD